MLRVLATLRGRLLPHCRTLATSAGTKNADAPKPPMEKNLAIAGLSIEGVTIIRTKEAAQRAIRLLYENKHKIHAWDTETIGIDAKEESPVGKGTIICASAFCGPEVDFGTGPRTASALTLLSL